MDKEAKNDNKSGRILLCGLCTGHASAILAGASGDHGSKYRAEAAAISGARGVRTCSSHRRTQSCHQERRSQVWHRSHATHLQGNKLSGAANQHPLAAGQGAWYDFSTKLPLLGWLLHLKNALMLLRSIHRHISFYYVNYRGYREVRRPPPLQDVSRAARQFFHAATRSH